MRKALCYMFVASLVFLAHATAGVRTGTVGGVVLERSGKPASGADVIIERSDGSLPLAARTNANGRYLFKYVHAGLYDIRASRGRTATVWKHNILVHAGRETVIDLRLEPIRTKPVP